MNKTLKETISGSPIKGIVIISIVLSLIALTMNHVGAESDIQNYIPTVEITFIKNEIKKDYLVQKKSIKETLEYLLGKTACANRRVIAEREWERIVELENQLLSYVNEKKKKGIENENKGGDDEYKQKLEELLGKAESAIAEKNKKNDETT